MSLETFILEGRMAVWGDLIRVQTTRGEPTTVAGVSIVPETKALVVRFPFGGLVWNRPSAIYVQHGQQLWRLPIVDVTLVGELALIGASAALIVLGMMGVARRVARR